MNDGAANVLRVLLNNAEPDELVEAVSDNLYWACKVNNEEMVEMLLQKGANPNTGVEGRLLLNQAYKNGNENIVKMLLAAGTEFNHMEEISEPNHLKVMPVGMLGLDNYHF
ncbi:MAG TPA: ankyrin repeat domain-containing protein [Rickettsia endosymbiont of Pyrocoelia pectoralis]|nr:ankyrin repeat domain-containing protein [Rickettsia endosymbiont of Pyrocoelia pectoralis]